MPFGFEHPVVGYLGFSVVKFAGYTLASHYIAESYRRPDRNRYLVGAARTLLGMAVGAAYAGIWSWVSVDSEFLYLAGLAPFRVFEWWLLLYWFFDRKLEQRAKGWGIVRVAVVWSYILDVPATIGLFVTGGLSIC